MLLKTGVSVAALGLALGLSAAMAQQAPPPAKTEAPKAPVTGQMVTQPEDTILTRDVIGQTVFAPDNSRIGSISDLLLTKDGKTVEGFVIGVGGFLGIGERSVALKMDQLKISPMPDGSVKLVADLKREDLTNAPAFKSRRDIEAEKKAAERPAQPRPGGGPGGGSQR